MQANPHHASPNSYFWRRASNPLQLDTKIGAPVLRNRKTSNKRRRWVVIAVRSQDHVTHISTLSQGQGPGLAAARSGSKMSVRFLKLHSIRQLCSPYALCRYMQEWARAPMAHSNMNPVPLFGSVTFGERQK